MGKKGNRFLTVEQQFCCYEWRSGTIGGGAGGLLPMLDPGRSAGKLVW